jgi:HEPN domain-containing protein
MTLNRRVYLQSFRAIVLRVTTADVITHWRKGARDALEIAKLALQAGMYDHVLFNCHLAVEKALKAEYMQLHGEEAPYTHNLLDLAETVDRSWTDAQTTALDELSDFVVAARYSDPVWAERYADAPHGSAWLRSAEAFLSLLHT